MGRETTQWVERARASVHALNGAVSWIFDEHDLKARLAWMEASGYGAGALVIHPIHGSLSEAAIVPYKPEEPYFPTRVEADADAASGNQCRELIVHPIWGTRANAALSTCRPSKVSALLSELSNDNPCRTVMIHPIWGSNAENALVPYGNDDSDDGSVPSTPSSPVLDLDNDVSILIDDVSNECGEGMDQDE